MFSDLSEAGDTVHVKTTSTSAVKASSRSGWPPLVYAALALGFVAALIFVSRSQWLIAFSSSSRFGLYVTAALELACFFMACAFAWISFWSLRRSSAQDQLFSQARDYHNHLMYLDAWRTTLSHRARSITRRCESGSLTKAAAQTELDDDFAYVKQRVCHHYLDVLRELIAYDGDLRASLFEPYP